jgi:uncharacterized protein YndB with AHSA1/START domain
MTSSARGSQIRGSLRSEGGKGIVRIEDRFDTGADDLWSALTEPRRLARWIGDVEGDLRLRGEFRARLSDAGDRTGRVEACEPQRRLLVRLRDPDAQPGQPAETTIEATLIASGEQTTLVVEQGGLPLELLAAYGAGVQIHVENLAAHLAGEELGDQEPRWEELLPVYQRMAAHVS